MPYKEFDLVRLNIYQKYFKCCNKAMENKLIFEKYVPVLLVNV